MTLEDFFATDFERGTRDALTHFATDDPEATISIMLQTMASFIQDPADSQYQLGYLHGLATQVANITRLTATR